jgi:3-hydroxyacyl-CoA dehydrogenase / enoyl-CoA hydratase / 3-hydroxybutyryl-CoA epimerase
MEKSIRLEKREDGVAVIYLDVPGEAQNTLKPQFKDELANVRKEIERAGMAAVVIASKKEGSFVAGADIDGFAKLKTEKDAAEMSKSFQAALDDLERSSIPYVAAIHGVCLGGGLELALACHARVATDHPKTKLGLPEVQLGLLPAGGGTQRLPREVGVEAALDLLLTGKHIDARRAYKMGLVQDVVAPAILVDVAAKLALELAKHKGKSFADKVAEVFDLSHLKEIAMAKNPVGRNLVFDQAEKETKKKAKDDYPAPYEILRAVKVGLEKGMKAGLEAEAEGFGRLMMTDVAKRLTEIFFATTELKKDNGTRAPGVKPRTVERIGILGAGIMGHGIASVSIDSGYEVRMKDRDDECVGRGLAAVRTILDGRVEKRRMRESERDRTMMLLSGATDYSGFGTCDLIIEAVFEELEVKHRVLKETEAVTKPRTIFASNTSSIPIGDIARASSRPEMVVGMHYFSPVHKMPLLEVIRTKQTLDEVIATAVEVGRKQKKTVIVVNDGVGFYTSRILGPYMAEAMWMIGEAIPIETIDRASIEFGFPVGPITLLDEVGIDTAAKVSKIARSKFGERYQVPDAFEKLVANGRTGRKGKLGFYTYDGKKKEVDDSVYDTLGVQPNVKEKHDLAKLGERLALSMIAEAIRCLEEDILRSPRDGDIGAIFGLGFPPFKGGPFRMADAIGAGELLARVRRLEEAHGKRFSPPTLLQENARAGKRFY